MLIVDINTLHPVDALHFADEVVMHRVHTAYREHIMRIDRAFRDDLAFFDGLAFLYAQAGTIGDQIAALIVVFHIGNDDVLRLLDLLQRNHAADFADDRKVFGLARLKQLLNTGKTLCDIGGRGNTAGMERTHGQLRARLADRLGGDDADCLAHGDRIARSKVRAVALDAYAVLGLAGQQGADLDPSHAGGNDALRIGFLHHLILAHNELSGLFVVQVFHQETARQALRQALDQLIAVLDIINLKAVRAVAVLLANDDVLRDIDQAAGQVTGVRRTQCRIGQAFPGAAGGDKVFENVQTLTIVRADGDLDRTARRIGDQAAHTSKLPQLAVGAAGAGIDHHIDGIVVVKIRGQLRRNLLRAILPYLDHMAGALCIRDKAALEVCIDLIDLLLRLGEEFRLLRRNGRIADRDGDAALRGIFIALRLDTVEHFGGDCRAVHLDALVDDLAKHLFIDQEFNLQLEGVLRIAAVYKAEILRDRIVENHAAQRGLIELSALLAVDFAGHTNFDFGMQANGTHVIGHNRLIDVAETLALARLAGLHQRQIIGAKDHILRRHDNRLSIGGFEQVVGRQHQETRLRLRLCGQRHMNGHLVAIKVRVEGGAYQRMQLNCTAFYENRLKRLDAKPVQRGRAVEHNGMILDDDLQRIPDLSLRALDHLAGRFDIIGLIGFDQPLHDKGLEQLERHLLGQTTLVELKLRADDDHGTAGIVDALAEQVLAETALFALEHVGQGFQRAVIRACYRTATAAVIDEGVHSLLQHALLIADNDIGCMQLQKPFQTVIAVDDAAVQVV